MTCRFVSLLGLAFFLLLAWGLSESRRKVPWRILVWGLALQFGLGLLVLRTGAGDLFFEYVKHGFDVITDASLAGASMVFGSLAEEFLLTPEAVVGADGPMYMGVFAFRVLPVIIFVSALTAVFYHLRITQAVVSAMAWLMRRTLKTSGAETVATALLVFLGIESVTALRGYLAKMTRSEINTVMTSFMATIATSVMVAYAQRGAEPGHLLAASLMSAPAAILISKLMVPETGEPETTGEVRVKMDVESHNVFDAITRGTGEGLQMALSVGAMLIALIGLVYLLNMICGAIVGHTFTELMGFAFVPFAWLMGIPAKDTAAVGQLLGTKTILNEFVAYTNLKELIAQDALSKRSITIATYALCGFANPGSIGIAVAGLSALVPERREDIVGLGLKSLIGGTLACFTTACVAGILVYA
jgi:CNT family concentrative nucleoside transporter